MLLPDLEARVETLLHRPTSTPPQTAALGDHTLQLIPQLRDALQRTPTATSVVAKAPDLTLPPPYRRDPHVRVYRCGKVELLARHASGDEYLILTSTHPLQAA